MKRTALEIMGVKEADAGMFTCTIDRNSEQHFLFVVTGKQTAQWSEPPPFGLNRVFTVASDPPGSLC